MSPVDMSPLDDRLAFARQVKAASGGELLDLMQSPRRASIVADIVEDLPAVFLADRAGDLEAVVHWKVTGRPDGGTDTLELVITQGTLVVSPEPARTPRLTLTLGPVDFLRMVTGNANAKLLFLRGRMKARGDLGLTTRFPTLFDTPRP
ncbi:SCP2 sterol-binding domain-containing protein [Streptomyces sp. SID13031]|uniref:SCP2 sterol-binding domain-containing protein n=1 Tax=Streptomyces sp. SID13031 TaxID=2706046 RepID=UPI0013C57E31|nr:SCP2 sterol-binding domain-containing protein [Streptomyces sp. SID13031]NEA33579.1 SCP2 sterol-binding domain-containing protein [Streptomyces sp. SID13031]